MKDASQRELFEMRLFNALYVITHKLDIDIGPSHQPFVNRPDLALRDPPQLPQDPPRHLLRISQSRPRFLDNRERGTLRGGGGSRADEVVGEEDQAGDCEGEGEGGRGEAGAGRRDVFQGAGAVVVEACYRWQASWVESDSQRSSWFGSEMEVTLSAPSRGEHDHSLPRLFLRLPLSQDASARLGTREIDHGERATKVEHVASRSRTSSSSRAPTANGALTLRHSETKQVAISPPLWPATTQYLPPYALSSRPPLGSSYLLSLLPSPRLSSLLSSYLLSSLLGPLGSSLIGTAYPPPPPPYASRP